MSPSIVRRARSGVVAAALVTAAAWAQPDPASMRPIRQLPSERFSVHAGVRDWGPATVAGNTVVAGGPTGKGGLFAIDAASGKLKWTFRPADFSGSVSTPPAVFGDIAIAAFGSSNPGVVVAVSLASGKALWRGPDPAVDAAVAIDAGLAYIQAKDGHLHALDAASGREIWKVAFSNRRAPCASRPIVRDGILVLTSIALTAPNDATKSGDYHLFALDAKTGQERWRYRAAAPYVHAGVCLRQPVVTSDTVFATGENRLYAVDRSSGRDRWPAVEVRRTRAVEVHGLVDAGEVLVGITAGALMAFDKASGQLAWEIAGQYSQSNPSTAVAGRVLYFQGSPGIKPAAESGGTLHALDLDTRSLLWSFSRPTAEAHWPFGAVTPVDGGLWVGSYQALVKLQ